MLKVQKVFLQNVIIPTTRFPANTSLVKGSHFLLIGIRVYGPNPDQQTTLVSEAVYDSHYHS